MTDVYTIPKIKLGTGEEIPVMGFGTFGSDKYSAEQIAEAVYGAVLCGYRMFDCASVYQNEKEIGYTFERVFKEKIVAREELFIISKVWNDMHGEGQVTESFRKSLSDLKLSYLDLYLIHWPFPNYHAPGCDAESRNPDSKPFSTDEFMIAWRQCEELKDKGFVKNIGMSNMTIPKLEAVLPLCRIKPVAVEMECHPSFQQNELFDYLKAHNIQPIGYCPIGSPSRPERDRTADDVADTAMPEVMEAAETHNVHPASICLKWAVQRGVIPIPFSVKEPQYVSNLKEITGNFLTDDEMESIRLADKNCRLVKGQVFLWNGAKNWEDLWDLNGTITTASI